MLNFDYMADVTQAALALVIEDTFPEEIIQQPSLVLDFVANDRLTWSPDPDAIGYDVIRGDLTRLRFAGGNFRVVMESCLADNTFGTQLVDPTVPSPGGADFYLLRAELSDGVTSWGTGTEVTPRDEGVDQSFFACP